MARNLSKLKAVTPNSEVIHRFRDIGRISYVTTRIEKKKKKKKNVYPYRFSKGIFVKNYDMLI